MVSVGVTRAESRGWRAGCAASPFTIALFAHQQLIACDQPKLEELCGNASLESFGVLCVRRAQSFDYIVPSEAVSYGDVESPVH